MRSAIQYDPYVGGFAVVNGNTEAQKKIQLSFIKSVFGEGLYDEHMRFITSFNMAAQWNKPAMILSMIINIFASDRPEIKDKSLVEEARMHYSQLLQAYLRSQYTLFKADTVYQQILAKLGDLKTYGEMTRQVMDRHSVTDSAEIEPLVKEMLTIPKL